MTDNLFDLTGDVVLVTGGGGLIGTEVCQAIDHHGAAVVVAEFDEERGRKVAEKLDRGEFVSLDITNPTSVDAVYEYVISEHGRLDGLVNLAYPRTDDYGQSFESVDKEELIKNVSMHLGGYYAVTKAAVLKMLEHGCEGSIVNFSSIYGMQAPDFTVYEGTHMTSPVEYSVLKAGVLNFTRYLASYLGSDGIRVNSVSPGGVFDEQPEQFVENYERNVPLGRMAEPEDVSGAVVYLLSAAASYVTGHNIVVDGGWTIK
ncbi:oxidoreductase [Halorientalis brevis]|uniref:Oxidoreductase n=1 Tax=Halorientalis brevis TaxID=1126241 RepID=A0ABD6C7X2_9EURY|nr:oxidoreductase [Halorientalis brevis]